MLKALLMSRDHDAMRTVSAALNPMGIHQEECDSAHGCLELITACRYSAVVLDFELPGAPQLARIVKAWVPRKRPVVFAMIGALNHIAAAFQSGADFVLYKPLAWDQVTRSLRAAQAFMLPERRQCQRHTPETVVYLQFGIAAVPALIVDISEVGMSIQSSEPLPAVRSIPLRFVLPGTAEMIEASGDMIWSDPQGRAGMLFSRMNSRGFRALQQWLRKRAWNRRSARSSSRLEDRLAPASLAQ